ncbi:Oleosin family protein [Euphorbia peplus]|nr:Oleosin family protein [Euphorbia peplus]
MADRTQPHQVQVHPQRYDPSGGYKGQQKGPSTGKVLAVITLLPVGGTLLFLAGITLMGTLIGLAISTPVFLLFSPILVPAAFVIGLAVMAFLASGAFGLTGLTSLSWVMRYVREATRSMPDQLDLAKRRMQDMAGFVGQKTKEVGQEIQRKAHHEGK